MSALAVAGWRDRIVDDGSNRESWLGARHMRIGASDAAGFARVSSVEKYVKAKLTPGFGGNESTESGNDWESALLTARAFESSKALIRHPYEERFVATPDAIREDEAGVHLAEVKTKHMQIVSGPKPHEIRQMAWQLFVMPEAVDVEFIWGEIVRDERSIVGWKLRRPVQHIVFTRDDPKIVAATELIVPIARLVLPQLTAAANTEVRF